MENNKKETTIIAIDEELDNYSFRNEPEKQLAMAILLNAISDYEKDKGWNAKTAKAYFLNSGEGYVFSFRSICSLLDIDYKKVLERVQELSA